MSATDVCICGDYRRDHVRGVGRCLFNRPHDLTHGFRDCMAFRLSERTSDSPMSRRYAEGTDVPSERSRGEIERTLTRYGADQFGYGWTEFGATILFRAKGRHVRFVLPLPDRTAKQFTHTPHTDKLRSIEAQRDAYEQAVRQRWRALALCIKAKLEAVEANISEFEDEFLAQIIMPDGQTVSHHIRPQIATAYDTGCMPPLLTYSGQAP